jgi:plastocyanin
MIRGILALAALTAFGMIGAGPTSAEIAGGTLVGTVGPGFTITLTKDGAPVTTLPAGDYTLTVTDAAANHNFHIFGPGLDEVVTSVPFIGTVTTTIHLTRGTFTFQCDPHRTVMIGTFTVPDTAPVANDDSAATTSGSATTIEVLANDTDADGDAITASIVTSPAGGTAAVNPDGTITYSAASFFAGTDTFTYRVSDGSLSSEPATVTVAVNDPAPPVLTVPIAMVANATSSAGAVVSFTATAADTVDPNPAVTCRPQSGSTFPIGTTTVDCTATDAAGNATSGSFRVRVRGAGGQLRSLEQAVIGVGPGRSLAAKVELARLFFAFHQTRATCLTLAVFNLEVRAQAGRKVPRARAAELIADSNRIRNVLDC